MVPPEWKSESLGEPESNIKLEKSTDRMFDVNAKTLDQMNSGSGKWQLSGMIFELAVSAEGVLGLLMGEGEAAVKTIWLRNDQSSESFVHKIKPISFSFQSKDSPQSIEKHSDLLMEMATASGKVRDPQLLKSNLMFKFNQFVEMGKLLNLSELEQAGWKISEFRQVLSITAEGDVTPGVALGGFIEFEMRWNIENESEGTQNFAGIFSRRKPALDALLNGLVSDLRAIEDEAPAEYEEKGFELEGFYIELGVKGESDFGIASASASAVGKLVFKRNDEEDLVKNKKSLAERSLVSSVNIVSEAPGPVSFTAQSSSNFQQVSRANRNVFRRGLHRALKMGRFFARRASKVESKKWYIKEIEPEFEIAVNGNVGLSTLEGSTALALEFERKDEEK